MTSDGTKPSEPTQTDGQAAGAPADVSAADDLPPSQTTAGRASRFSGFHARTYEMELLLSGAVVFGLAQLPPLLERFFGRFLAGLAGQLFVIGALTRGYVVLGVYALIGTFVLHLALRGFWIGLLGLESVYPGGIRWERLRMGPLTLGQVRRSMGSLGRAIDHVDDLCSLVFSFGFLIVVAFVHVMVWILFSAAAAFIGSRLLLGNASAAPVFWVVLVSLLSLQSVASGLDRLIGGRLEPGRFPRRVLRGLVWIGYQLSPMRWTGPIQLTLASNLSETRVAVAIVTACLALGVVYIGQVFVGAGALRLDSRAYYPARLDEHGLDPDHYRDRREPGTVRPKVPSPRRSGCTFGLRSSQSLPRNVAP